MNIVDLKQAIAAQAVEQQRQALEDSVRSVVLAIGMGCGTTTALQEFFTECPQSYAQIKVILKTSTFITDSGPAGNHGRHWSLTQKGENFLTNIHEYRLMNKFTDKLSNS